MQQNLKRFVAVKYVTIFSRFFLIRNYESKRFFFLSFFDHIKDASDLSRKGSIESDTIFGRRTNLLNFPRFLFSEEDDKSYFSSPIFAAAAAKGRK